MDLVLDAAVQFVQVGLLLVVVALNFDLRARIKRLEEKLSKNN